MSNIYDGENDSFTKVLSSKSIIKSIISPNLMLISCPQNLNITIMFKSGTRIGKHMNENKSTILSSGTSKKYNIQILL